MSQFERIMIVEDDDAIREALQMLIEEEGYGVITAHNGKEALELLSSGKAGHLCLILLDLMMPEMNGWEFLELRRHADVVASIPVIVVSASTDKVDADRPGKVLRKPLDIKGLLADVEVYCGEAAKTGELVRKPLKQKKAA